MREAPGSKLQRLVRSDRLKNMGGETRVEAGRGVPILDAVVKLHTLDQALVSAKVVTLTLQ